MKLAEERQVEIKLFYGQSAIEVEAKAVIFGAPNLQLPVTFVVGAMSERKVHAD